ncbi:MAG: glutathione transferase GstA [Polyangiaceae bacterium]|nr:glutathione transferase GstA [Polyangiaceae bacterium]
MKLYFSPGACSLAPHIVAREAGIDIGFEKVDTKTKKTETGADYASANPKGYVPALQLDDGALLTEGPVISQYLAEKKPGSGLVPEAGSMARFRVQELLGYINSEIHKSYSPLFYPTTPEETRQDRLAYLKKRYALIDKTLADKQFLTGDTFTIADAYLFVVTNWAGHVKLDLSDYPNLLAFQQRVAARPAVQAALKFEGLVKG